MRVVPTILAFAALAAFGGEAFDAAEWSGRRALLTREAERLRAAYSNVLERVTEPAEDVVIPLETHKDGSVALSIAARRSQIFLKEELVWAEDVMIQRMDEKGAVISSVAAASCLFDRSTRSGWAEGRARLSHAGSSFDGENVYFSAEENYVMSLGSTLLATKDLRFGRAMAGGERLPTGEALEIRAQRCDFDREAGVALFDGGVKVDYRPGYTLCSERLMVFFKGTNELDRIIASRNVAITNETRIGRCGRAVFTRKGNELEMQGTRAVPARLADGDAYEATGVRIRFWLDNEQAEIEESEIKVKKSKGSLKVL